MIEICMPFPRPPTIRLKDTKPGKVSRIFLDKIVIETIEENQVFIDLFSIEKIDIPIKERR